MDKLQDLVVPPDHGSSALLWFVVVAAVGLLGWLVRIVVSRIADGQEKIASGQVGMITSVDGLTEAVRDLPRAIADAVRVAVREEAGRRA